MKPHIPLCNLELNKKAKVIEFNCTDYEKRRYLDLGITKNTILTPIFRSPFGSPTAYEIRKTIIAIRDENAMNIKVQEL